MKKVSTRAAKQSRNLSRAKLTIGLDLGDRSSCYCVLDESGRILLERKISTKAKALGRVLRHHAAQPHRAGDRDAFALGEPVAERVET